MLHALCPKCGRVHMAMSQSDFSPALPTPETCLFCSAPSEMMDIITQDEADELVPVGVTISSVAVPDDMLSDASEAAVSVSCRFTDGLAVLDLPSWKARQLRLLESDGGTMDGRVGWLEDQASVMPQSQWKSFLRNVVVRRVRYPDEEAI